jgi:hypothetical protein
MGVLAIRERTKDALRTIAFAKLTFNGDVADILHTRTAATSEIHSERRPPRGSLNEDPKILDASVYASPEVRHP